MTALDGTLALAEPDRVSVLVGQHLHFDVAGINDRFLDINFAVSERTLCLALGGFERGAQFLAGVHQAHSFAASAGRGLQHDRIADALGDLLAFFGRSKAARSSGNEGNASLFHLLPGAGFRSHHFHGARSRTDEFQSGIGAGLSELCVLRKKAVAGMDGFGAGAFGYVEDFVHPQIRFGCRSRADGVGFVGFADMERGAVDIGIDGNGRDADFAAGANDAHRDLSAIGDQNLLEHFANGPAAGIARFYLREWGVASGKSLADKSSQHAVTRLATRYWLLGTRSYCF